MQPIRKFENFYIKIATLFATFVGCVTIVVAPFYVPFINLLGATFTIFASIIVLLALTLIATDGFSYVKNKVVDAKSELFLQITIYCVSISSQILAILLALRILKYAFEHFLQIPLDFFKLL